MSQTVPSRSPPQFWPFCMSYRCSASRLDPPIHIHDVYSTWDGIIKPGKSASALMIPWAHTDLHFPISFVLAILYACFPSYTIYMDASPTIWSLGHHQVVHVHGPILPMPSLRFFQPQSYKRAEGCMYLCIPMYISSPHGKIWFIWPLFRALARIYNLFRIFTLFFRFT